MIVVRFDERGEITHATSARTETHSCGKNELYVDDALGFISPTAFYVSEARELVRKPDRPTMDHVWDSVAKEWRVDESSMRSSAGFHRSQLLAQSDWTQLPDVPIATKEAWATYRQALRDITEQPGFPLDIVWPTPPA